MPTSSTSSPTTAGRSWPASLVDPFGGDVNAYGGTDRLADRATPTCPRAGQSGAIEVDVALPADLAPRHGDEPGPAQRPSPATSGSEVLSEFPGTPAAPRPDAARGPQVRRPGRRQDAPDATVAGPGDEVTYTMRVTNHGPSDAVGVDSVADSLPDGLSFRSAAGGRGPSGRRHRPLAGVRPRRRRPPGRDRQRPPPTSDVRQAAARTTATSTTRPSVQHPGDPNPDNDRDTAVVPVDHPDLVVDPRVTPDQRTRGRGTTPTPVTPRVATTC